MKAVIIYGSKTGNTKKIAESMNEELNADLFDIATIMDAQKANFWSENPADIYLLGSGIYADKLNNQLTNLIKNNPPPSSSKFALFATWIGRGNSGPDTLDKLKTLIEKRGAIVQQPYFLCYGKMLAFHRNLPNEDDMKNAKKWAKSLA